MLQDIGMFLLKYWLEILFTAFIGLASYFGKRYIKLEIDRKSPIEKAGITSGNVTPRNVCHQPAPSILAASLTESGMF